MKKSRLEILRGKLEKSGIRVALRDDMPEDVAALFIREMLVCPDCAGAAAQNWTPEYDTTMPEILAVSVQP